MTVTEIDVERFPGGLVAPTDLMDALLPLAPNFMPDTVKSFALSVVREFFKRSSVWMAWSTVTVQPGKAAYTVGSPASNAEAYGLWWAVWAETGTPLTIVPEPAVLGETQGLPTTITHRRNLEEILLQPTPISATADLRVLCSYVPRDLCIPGWALQEHLEAFSDGVAAKLYAIPTLSTFNLQQSAMLQRSFRAKAARAAILARKDYAIPDTVGLFPSFTGRVGSGACRR